MSIPRPSSQWERINRTALSDAESMPLDDFKSSAANHKISIWEPAHNGVRFLKELIFNLTENFSPREWELLRAVPNRHIGSPYSIAYEGELVCLDYLQAVFEVVFMESKFDFNRADVLEIGAGYGRTCHTILSTQNINSYTIVDLDKSLVLGRRYLAEVLSASCFERIRFVPVEEFDSLGSEAFDICVNVDSFAEMDSDVVYQYLAYIRTHCRWLFTKNPVGKYLDKSLDGHFEGDEAVQFALKNGILRDIIDIYDNVQVRKQAENFVKAYSPGNEWRCMADGKGRPWSFYWQALYTRGDNGEQSNSAA